MSFVFITLNIFIQSAYTYENPYETTSYAVQAQMSFQTRNISIDFDVFADYHLVDE